MIRRLILENLSIFCTCTFTDCKLHPSNHNKGCSLCILKNLENEEIPNCFFNKVGLSDKREGYKFKDFAEVVIKTYSDDVKNKFK